MPASFQLTTTASGTEVAALANSAAEAIAVLDAAPAGRYIIPATSTQALDSSSPRWFQNPTSGTTKTFKIKSVTVTHATAIPYTVTYTLFRKNKVAPLFVALTDIVVPSNSIAPITILGTTISTSAPTLLPGEGIFFLQQNNIPEATGTATPNLSIKVLLTPVV